jgi:SAM-dependent methyltransferase
VHPENLRPKELVAPGYDAIAGQHAEWASHTRTDERERYTAVLLHALPPGARVLELGCGVGVPTTQRLAQRFAVTGVDISAQHIALAQCNVPTATFVQADMAALDFPPAGFDAVAAFYSIIHVPRDEHPGLVHDIATWLRPGGLLVATMGAGSTAASVEPDWLGVPMYFSHFDAATNQRLVEVAGLRIISAREETADEDGVPVTFLSVVARKP